MKFTIYRGTKEIGGTCIHLKTDTASVAIDAGMPLTSDNDDTSYINNHFDAVVISHSHQDHYGLIEKLDKNIPVYVNKLQLDLINASKIFRGLNPLDNKFVFYEIAKPFTIGNITIHPYLVDHSAPNSFAFLIECEGKRLFYTGDFRAHGRKKQLFEKQIKTPELKNCDLMLMEGTMIERDNYEFPSEEDVQHEITSKLRHYKGMAFIVTSSQNIDRLTSAFKACQAIGRELVLDFYTAWVLYQLKDISDNLKYILNNVRILDDGRISGNQYGYMKQSSMDFNEFINFIYSKRPLKFDGLNNAPENYLVVIRMYGLKQLKYFTDPLVIYSQWQGYLDEPQYDFARHIKDNLKNKWVYVHTSGHAVVEDLKRYVEALRPRVLVPIHTLQPERFEEALGGVVNVEIVDDNKPINL